MALDRLFIITGDYSGDVHAAHVADALKRIRPDIAIAAVGGENLRSRGVQLISDQSAMGRVGFGSILGAPYHYFLGRRILRFLRDFRPQAVLLIDYGVFNLWMAHQLKKMGVPVFYFIPPQVWASRRGRLKAIRKNVDHVFCIFPFEEELYRAERIPVTYVGHPLVGQLPPPVERREFCQRHGLDPARPIIGIFPGSRKMEINYLLREIIGSLPRIRAARPDAQFVLARASSLPEPYFARCLEAACREAGLSDADRAALAVKVTTGENHAVLSASDALIAKSGTTTLEAALYGAPMIIIYKGHPVAYRLALWMCYLPCIGLPNILTDMKNPPIPELWQGAVNPRELAERILPLLSRDSAEFQRQKAAFSQIQTLFNVGEAPANVANAILSLVEPESRPT